MRELKDLVRPNIWNLTPYSCARDEYSGMKAKVYLDANESPYNAPYNRYPDPLQKEVKALLSKIKNVPEPNIFLGNGSDEAIDLMYRCFCNPGKDNVVAIEPTYGMYKVCADINEVEYRPVLLDDKYQMDADAMLYACDDNTKIIWICSPNNPTGNLMNPQQIEEILREFEGMVVVDEAYGDFSGKPQFRQVVTQHPNLVVLNTMSKAWACAAIRLGMAFASKELIDIFNKVKYPYNVNILTQDMALKVLKDPFEVDKQVRTILDERERLISAFNMLPICKKINPTDANFFLVEVKDALATYKYLMNEGIIVRNRHRVILCNNCLRITVGTRGENTELLGALRRL